MVNPGAFHGARKVFLMGEKPAYAAGVVGGYAGDALALIQRRYFKRFPVELPHEDEPSAEEMAAVDDDAPDQDHQLPDREAVGEEAYALAERTLEERSKLVKFRKAQIKRWLAYQYMKDNDVDPKESGAQNPYRVLLHKLTGVGITRPRAKTTVNIWRKTQKATIEEEVSRRITAAGLGTTHKKNLAALRDKVARDLFSGLSEEEKEEWVERAQEENEAALERWKRDTEGPPSKEPADRQRCIQGLVRFAQPILDAICEATGWSATLIAGGPEPADGGRLNIVSVHSGTTSGDVKMNFGRAERLRFKKMWVPVYGQFLQKCYTLDECRARALATDEGHLALSGLDLWNDSDGATFDAVVTHAPAVADPRAPPPTSLPIAPPALPPSSAQPDNRSPVRSVSQAARSPPPSVPPSVAHTPAPSPPPSAPHSPAPSPPASPSRVPAASVGPMESNGAAQSPTGRRVDTAASKQGTAPAAHSNDDRERDGVGARPVVADATRGAAKRKRDEVGAPDHDDRPSVAQRTRARATAASSASLPSPAPATRLRTSSRLAHTAPITTLATPRPKPRPLKKATAQSASIPQPSESDSARHGSSTSKTPAQHDSGSTSSAAKITEKHPNAPAWFKSAYAMLDNESLGTGWLELIKLWAVFENQERYQHISMLKTSNRPRIVAEWIRRARSNTWRPEIDNFVAYEEDMREWWAHLQPAWRVSNGAVQLDAVDGSWESLRCPGINGLLGVLAGLFYWGLHIVEHGEDGVLWQEITLDCGTALSHLIS